MSILTPRSFFSIRRQVMPSTSYSSIVARFLGAGERGGTTGEDEGQDDGAGWYLGWGWRRR